MNCLDTHFRLNRFLLLAIGLWPLKRSKFAQVQFIILFSILITFIIFQFTSLLTSRCTVDLIVNILSSTFFFICLAIKYNSFWINADTMRLSLEKLQHTCNELKNEDEIAIIEKYSRIGKIQTIAITMFGAMSLCSFLLLTLGPYAFNIVFSVNNSQSRIVMVLKTEYFIDQEKYFYLIVLHGNAALFIGATAMVATGTMMIAYLKYICGMLTIASYRIKEAMTINVQQDIDHEKMIICYRGIVCAVDIHRKAIEFSQVFIKSFQGSFFFLIAAGMICLSNNLVQIALYVNTLKQFILSLTFVMVLYVYMFLSNYTAQEITDHNEYVFATVYNVLWYVAPLQIQKMMLFILQKGTKAFHLVLGGIFIASMESAASLMGTSISYFTVLYSTWQN
ncbi:odorant receptor Or2-like [Cardiocondyla obscurior]|uniref:odorant receptor Or2-like n=1 Tax=Cardiocondyla obscurior TaxID=286306 RepID=UPI0039657617